MTTSKLLEEKQVHIHNVNNETNAVWELINDEESAQRDSETKTETSTSMYITNNHLPCKQKKQI